MKRHHASTFAALLASAGLCAASVVAAKIEFAPPSGATATKSFQHTMELSLDNMNMLLNGEESPMMPDIEMSLTMEQLVKVTDTYVAVANGRPSKLSRTFDELGWDADIDVQIEMAGTSNDQNQTMSGASELEGKTVAFAWSEEEAGFKKSFEGEEGNAELLEGLEEDMDLRVLLPPGDVAEGDEWEIDVSKLRSILSPGGNLAILPEDMPGLEEMMMGGGLGGSMSDMVGDILEGEASGTFKGYREVDGGKVAVIEVRIDVESSNDMTDAVQEFMDEIELPAEIGEMELDHMEMEFAFEAEGTLLWNVAAGRVHSFELSGDTDLKIDQGISISAQGQDMNMQQTVELSGTMNIAVATE
jgi:hypothetical protein